MLPLVLGIVGAKLLGGLFGAKSKKKQAEAQNKAAIGQAELQNQMSEDRRLGKLAAGQSLLQQLTGSGFTNIDPATAAKLGERRTYDFSKGVPAAGAGLGSSLLSGLFGAVGDIADTYGARSGAPMSPGQPVRADAVPMQEVPGAGMLSGVATEDPNLYGD